MDQFGLALGSGIVAALLATGIWAIALAQLRPKIVISPMIALAHENGGMTYRVKIINRGRRTVANVRCEMDILTSRNVKGGQVEVREAVRLRTNSLNQLPGRRRRDKNFTYCFRFGTNEDLRAKWKDDQGQRLVFRVFAQDAVSRVGRAFEQEYNNKGSDLVPGMFAIGDHFDVGPATTISVLDESPAKAIEPTTRPEMHW